MRKVVMFVQFTDVMGISRAALLEPEVFWTTNFIHESRVSLGALGLHNFGADLAKPVSVTVTDYDHDGIFGRVLFSGVINC